MIKADSKRLTKALIISVVFHVFLFFGMSFLNWLPENKSIDKYEPLTVKIENRLIKPDKNIFKEENQKDKIEPSPAKVSETTAVEHSVPKIEPAFVSGEPIVEFDPYADLGSNYNSIPSISDPEPFEQGEQQTPYIPTGKNIIELETPTAKDTDQSFNAAKEPLVEPGVSVLSEDEFIGLEQAVSKENRQGSSESVRQPESNSDFYEYRDVPVEFDNPEVRRELLTSPSPKIPDDLPSGFPSEITYIIYFSLNSDGLVKVLSISPSLLYPSVDASIRKALRSWTFRGSSGSESVEGKITLIFKGK